MMENFDRLKAQKEALLAKERCPNCAGLEEELSKARQGNNRILARNVVLAHENAKLEKWVSDLQSGMFINCVYCGYRYGPKDKVACTMQEALKQHVEQCPKHPMSALRAQLEEAREIIFRLVGSKDPEELQRMRAMIRSIAGPPETIEAIDFCIAALCASAPLREAAAAVTPETPSSVALRVLSGESKQ